MNRFGKLAIAVALSVGSLSAAGKAVEKSWRPNAFALDGDALPAKYSGVDAAKFLGLFKSKIGTIKKGEYETSEEFNQRSRAESVLAPISTSELYAFRLKGPQFKYDADLQAYRINPLFDTLRTCQEDSPIKYSGKWMICEISQLDYKDDYYVGANAFGATREIHRTRVRNFGIAMKANEFSLKQVCSPRGYRGQDCAYDDKVQVSLEKAKSLKGKQLSVLVIGRVTGTQIFDGVGAAFAPTLSSPDDYLVTTEAIPFQVKEVIYYVFETGEILARKSL